MTAVSGHSVTVALTPKGGPNAAGSEEQWNICSDMAETVNIATGLYYKQITMTLSDFCSYINQSHIIYTYSKYM